jgi:hypothetical protein
MIAEAAMQNRGFHHRDHREEEKLRRKEKRTIAAAPTKRGIGRLRAVW